VGARLNVCVLGLWHLGAVTAACLAARGHDVTGVDFDAAVVEGLATGTPPVFEPDLARLIHDGLEARALRFTTDAAAVSKADIVWVAYDTPVDDDDRADAEYVVQRIAGVFRHLRDGALVLVSSQLPVGTTARLERAFTEAVPGRTVGFAYSPENLRLGRAIRAFLEPDRIVVGTRHDPDRDRVARLLAPLGARVEWMSVESAEMTKHAINAFLATSVAFANEVAAVCEQVGADAADVARGLKSESRIGPAAYLSPGAAFAGGTLARDVVALADLGRANALPTHLLSAVKASNDAHRRWAARVLVRSLGTVADKTVAVWGLTYKPGTDTLRRSNAVELCEWLHAQGATVRAHDPMVKRLPGGIDAFLHLAGDPLDAVTGASALVVSTPWPEYRGVEADSVAARMTRRLVLDASRFLGDTLGRRPDVEYLSVGRVHA
jgi:UDPglucose 6-dehydrogenase